MKKFSFATAFISFLLLYNVNAFSVDDIDQNYKAQKKLVNITNDDVIQSDSYSLMKNHHNIDIGGKILSYVWFMGNSKTVQDHGTKLGGILNIKSVNTNPDLGILYGANLQLAIPAIENKHFIPSMKAYNRGAQVFIDSCYGNLSLGYQEGVESIMKIDAFTIGAGDNSIVWAQHIGLSKNARSALYQVFSGLYSESLFNGSDRMTSFDNKDFVNNLPFRISYQSPNFVGIRFGISYSPTGYDTSLFEHVSYRVEQDKLVPFQVDFIGANYENIISSGVSYSHSYNDVDFQASLVGEYASDNVEKLKKLYKTYSHSEDLSAFAIGSSIAYHNMIVAASYGYLGKSGYMSKIAFGAPFVNINRSTYYWNIGAKYMYDKASVSTSYFKSNKFGTEFYDFNIGIDYNLSLNSLSKRQYKIFGNYHYFNVNFDSGNNYRSKYNGGIVLLGVKYEF